MELKQGYKQTEVGVIPEDWQIFRLHELADLTSSKRIFENDYVQSGIPFYRGKEISQLIEGVEIDDVCYITEAKYSAIKSQFGAPVKGDILITAVGTLANVYVVDTDSPFYFKDGNLIWLRNIKGVIPLFLGIQLRRAKSAILDGAIGSSQKALTIVVLKELPVALPSSAEQRAIATALSDVDALMTAQDKLIAKKRDIKQAAMQQLLTGKQRLLGFTGEWEVKRLGDVGEIVTGSTPPTQIKEYWNGSIPWITPTDISDKKDMFSSEREITLLGLQAIRKLPADSLLVTCIASIGKNAILRNNGACNQQINAIIPNDNNSVEFLYYLVENSKSYLLGNAGITATLMISKKDFSEISFSFPPIAEQTAIATILSDMDAELAALEQQRDKTRALKQGMMQELLTGRIRLV